MQWRCFKFKWMIITSHGEIKAKCINKLFGIRDAMHNNKMSDDLRAARLTTK